MSLMLLLIFSYPEIRFLFLSLTVSHLLNSTLRNLRENKPTRPQPRRIPQNKSLVLEVEENIVACWLPHWLAPFSSLFTQQAWRRLLVLLVGAILTTHRRTVSAVLRATGYEQAPDFARYHAVLNRGRWSALAASCVLLGLLNKTFAPTDPIAIGLDDTIERPWGTRIKARGIYRDPVRSSHGHFVKPSGLTSAPGHAAGANPMGVPGLAPAAWRPAENPDRLRAANAAANFPLASGQAAHRGLRQPFCGDRPARCYAVRSRL